MTKLSVETEDLAVIIQEARGTLMDVQQLYARGASLLWATNRSSTGISSAYQRTTTELTRIINTMQTTRQVLEDLQLDTDKPSSSGIMGKLKSLGDSIRHFAEPVVNAANKVRNVVEGIWNAWTGESAQSLLKKMMNNQAAFAAASTTSQFLEANVQSIQLKGALKQQYSQLHQIMQSMGQAFKKGGEAAVNRVLSSLQQADKTLHDAYSHLAGYAELFAEDVKEKLDSLEDGIEKGLEEVSSMMETGAGHVKSFLNDLAKGAKGVY
jgi:archaellum component FlaC